MFFSIPNINSIVVSQIEKPWEYNKTKIPDDIYERQDKDEYRRWCANLSTEHAFISANEALDPGRRVSYKEGNPALKCHALIVDYDAINMMTDDLLKEIATGELKNNKKWPSEFPPAYVADSFTKGRLRAIWLFEKPVMIASEKHYKKFIQIIDKKIKFNKWFSGFEAESLGNPAHHYMIGHNYRAVRPDKLIPKASLDMWSFDAATQVSDTLAEVKYKIPMEEIAMEVERQFPGRWHGPFEVGARGVRFWDSSSSDPSGAVVMENGMLAYSGEQSFLPWQKILGSRFVEKFEADKISAILDNIVLEQKKGASSSTYWVRISDQAANTERWVCMNQTQITMRLQCLGFSSSIPRSGTASEVTRILDQVHLTRSVSGAFPYIHYPHGIMTLDGKRVLNTSEVRVLQPAPEGMCTTLEEGRTYFPTVWAFLSKFFEQTPKDPRSPNIQLEFFLSWLQHAYRLYYHQTPQPGLILIMVGPQSAGKSFLLQKIIAKMLGGSHDIKDILSQNGDKYTDLLTQSPVAYIDDLSSITNSDEHKRYSERIKGLVSNHQITFNGKWKSTGETIWMGRIVICMNDDASSVRMMPDLSLSMAGKVSLLMVNRNRDDGYRFSSDWHSTEKKLQAELPFFCRWLLDGWKIPDYLENHSNPRYYVVPYKHPDLYHEAQERGVKHELYELLQEFMEDNRAINKNGYDGWTGTTTALQGSLGSGKYEMVMRKWSTTRLGTALGLLASTTNLRKIRGPNNISMWHIPADFSYLKQEEFGEKIHTTADEKKRIKALIKGEKYVDPKEEARQAEIEANKPLVPGIVENRELIALTAAMREETTRKETE